MGNTEAEHTTVWLGNRNAIEIVDDPDDRAAAAEEERAVAKVRRVLPKAKRCTTVVIPPGLTLMEAAHDLTHANGVWQAHSNDPAPAWVAATGPLSALAPLLSSHWGCELRDPEPGAEPATADQLVEQAKAAEAGSEG